MVEHKAIPVLSGLWVVGVVASTVCGALAVAVHRRSSPRVRRETLTALGIAVIGTILITHLYLVFGAGTWSLADSLPLHVCRMSCVVAGLALITRRQSLCEWAAYIGFPAGGHSILTPELTQGDAPWMLFDYYALHSMLVIAPILLFLDGFRPRGGTITRLFVMLNIIAVVVYQANTVLGANYMYLNRKPIAENPILIGSWPWYLVALEGAFLAHLAVMDVAFRVVPKWRARNNAGDGTAECTGGRV